MLHDRVQFVTLKVKTIKSIYFHNDIIFTIYGGRMIRVVRKFVYDGYNN